MVAYQLGLDWPESVRSLMIVNSTPEMVPQSLKERIQIWQRFLIVWLFGTRGIGKILSRRFFPEPEQAELRKVFVERWAENDRSAYLAAMKSILGWSVADRLEEIHCPTLLVSAAQDYFPSNQIAIYQARIQQSEQVVIEGAGHALPAEKPGEFNTAINEFLAEQKSDSNLIPSKDSG
jgi:pimeloyl-ACP methyl ester carboxylesterase